MGSSQMILRGAAERRAFFVKQTGVGANAQEPIDEGEVHRLSRDSIRRRYLLRVYVACSSPQPLKAE